MNIGCKVVVNFERPSKEIIELFRGVPVANIDDNMGRIAAVDSSIRPQNTTILLGTAFTIRVPQGDNLMFHKAMDMIRPGDVIVIDAGGFTERSIFGELMTLYCMKKGAAGIVVDGAIRDYDAIHKMDFPVYAKSVTPNGPYKNGPGEINVPIVIGGKIVHPGDIIVGDQDGIIIIPPSIAKEVADKTMEVVRKEEKIKTNIISNGTYDRPWVDKKLKEIGCEFL